MAVNEYQYLNLEGQSNNVIYLWAPKTDHQTLSFENLQETVTHPEILLFSYSELFFSGHYYTLQSFSSLF